MIKGYIKMILLAISLLPIPSMCQSYHKRVVANIEDFTSVIIILNQKHLLELNDSIHLQNGEIIKFENKCLFAEQVSDQQIKDFMKKYDLKRICFSQHNDEFFDSVISFHKDYSPFFGKAVVITYDFGKSGLRDMTNLKIELKDEKVSIINDMYLYRIRSRPSFGE
jgi:hypothetical protein